MSLYLGTSQGPYKGLINWGKAATALQADQGPYEPIAWESQSEPDWVTGSHKAQEWMIEPEWARESTSESERPKVSMSDKVVAKVSQGEQEWARVSPKKWKNCVASRPCSLWSPAPYYTLSRNAQVTWCCLLHHGVSYDCSQIDLTNKRWCCVGKYWPALTNGLWLYIYVQQS